MKHQSNWLNPLADWSKDPEEAANTLTHGLGFLLSLVGAAVMLYLVLREGDAWRILGCTIYASSLIAVYLMSTLSHVCLAPARRHFFRTLDQAFIYVLIVGTYTPFSLAYLRSGPWWLFLALMWSIAIFGFLSKVLHAHRVDAVATWIYIALGWMSAASAPTMLSHVPTTALWWMLVGGLCYTAGTIFLAFDTHIRHFHAVWHLFVIAGSACHYFVILIYVAS
jgi:hemolysin III